MTEGATLPGSCQWGPMAMAAKHRESLALAGIRPVLGGGSASLVWGRKQWRYAGGTARRTCQALCLNNMIGSLC
jgi:hypothetical protein